MIKHITILLAFLMMLSSTLAAQDFSKVAKGMNAFEAGDYKTAIEEWTPLAEKGDVASQLLLATIYYHGEGVDRNYTKALKWAKLAGHYGIVEAQFLVGSIYENGYGVAQDHEKALKWFKLAAEQGYEEAQYNVGIAFRDAHGTPKDDQKAVKWLRLSADQGYANAQDDLGLMFASGQGVNKDFSEAVKWMELSAKQEYPSAQHNLGVSYAFGLGAFAEDYVLGFQWLKISIANGNKQSQEAINMLGKKMSAEQLMKAQAMARKCVASGYTECGY